MEGLYFVYVLLLPLRKNVPLLREFGTYIKEILLEDVKEKLVDDFIAINESLVFNSFLNGVGTFTFRLKNTLVQLLIIIWKFYVRVIPDFFSQIFAGFILLLF